MKKKSFFLNDKKPLVQRVSLYFRLEYYDKKQFRVPPYVVVYFEKILKLRYHFIYFSFALLGHTHIRSLFFLHTKRFYLFLFFFLVVWFFFFVYIFVLFLQKKQIKQILLNDTMLLPFYQIVARKCVDIFAKKSRVVPKNNYILFLFNTKFSFCYIFHSNIK